MPTVSVLWLCVCEKPLHASPLISHFLYLKVISVIRSIRTFNEHLHLRNSSSVYSKDWTYKFLCMSAYEFLCVRPYSCICTPLWVCPITWGTFIVSNVTIYFHLCTHYSYFVCVRVHAYVSVCELSECMSVYRVVIWVNLFARQLLCVCSAFLCLHYNAYHHFLHFHCTALQ